MASIARDQLNSDHQRISDVADAVWPDDVLDVRLDRVVIADIDGVAGFKHMLDRRAVVTVTNDGDSVAPAKVAGEIGQQELVPIASGSYALPNRASESHVDCRYQILWLCGGCRDDCRSGLDFRVSVGIGVIGCETFPKSVEQTVGTNYFG